MFVFVCLLFVCVQVITDLGSGGCAEEQSSLLVAPEPPGQEVEEGWEHWLLQTWLEHSEAPGPRTASEWPALGPGPPWEDQRGSSDGVHACSSHSWVSEHYWPGMCCTEAGGSREDLTVEHHMCHQPGWGGGRGGGGSRMRGWEGWWGMWYTYTGHCWSDHGDQLLTRKLLTTNWEINSGQWWAVVTGHQCTSVATDSEHHTHSPTTINHHNDLILSCNWSV